MNHRYVHGDTVASGHLSEALPNSDAPSSAAWTQDWRSISTLHSTVYGFAIENDIWTFPRRLFRETSVARRYGNAAREVNFRKLRSSVLSADAEGVVRRAKRMAWIYLHAPKESMCSAITEVCRLNNFISLISLLAEADVLKNVPHSACPDGPVFFGELSRNTFENLIPKEKSVRNGVVVLKSLPAEVDDQIRFSVKSYNDFWQTRSKDENLSQGKHGNAVRLSAIDDLNLSKLLAVCNVYRSYTDILEIIWNWLEGHRARALDSGRRTGVYRASGGLMLIDSVRNTFRDEILCDSRKAWIAAELIKDDKGDLTAPIYSHTQRVYRSVYDFIDRGALKTTLNTIIYSNAIFLAFLTGMRSQEVYSLPFEALLSPENRVDRHAHIRGFEFKSNDQIEGSSRSWPLPRIAVSLVTNTQRLHRLRSHVFGGDCSRFLFDIQPNISKPFKKMLVSECNFTEPSDNLIRRMRPSSAQLVADIARSPLAVRTVLGHANIEESLGYCRGKPDDEYREMIEQSKRLRDRKVGQEMIAEVLGGGATDRMAGGVIKMGIDQIVAMNLGDQIAVARARDLQEQIDKIKPRHFSEVYEMIGEDRWRVEEFIGESVAQPRPFQFCVAKKGGKFFSGACSKYENMINPQNCKSFCPYNFEAHASLELRADWIEKELSRGHFGDAEVTTEDPIFYNSAMKILDWLWSFEGPLSKFKTDIRLISVMERIVNDNELVSLFKGEARRTLRELGVL